MSSQPQSRDTQKPQIQITNIVSKSKLVPPLSFSALESEYPFDRDSRSAPIFHGTRIPISYKHIKFSIFRTGTILSRAARSLNELDESFSWLSSFLLDFNLELSNKYDILNIAALSDFFSSFNLSELASHIPNCSYDPSPLLSEKDNQEHLVDCIVYYFHEDTPRYTALIFATGKVIFTGFKSVAELELSAFKLASLFSQIRLEYPEVLSK